MVRIRTVTRARSATGRERRVELMVNTAGRVGRPASNRRSGEVLGEPVLHPLPRVGGRLRVVALAGVVEERVIGVLLDDEFIDQASLGQRLLGGILRRGDPGVLGAVQAKYCSTFRATEVRIVGQRA